ncbi:MAG: chromosomal replication initiator protein DnaA [bacterium]|nr:chromosomal replication initiator protein DnaA [bacterium]
MDLHELWKTALADIELSVSRPNFITWFKDTRIASFDGGKMVVSVPNGFAKEWLQNKYNKFVVKAVRSLAPEIREIEYAIGDVAPQSAAHDRSIKSAPRRTFEAFPQYLDQLDLKEALVNPTTNLNPRYTFQNFVVGSFNEFAHAAAQSIVKKPGGVYNPLFIYGGVGLGKTHLIQAIGNALIGEQPSAKVRYVSSEKYMGEIVDALKTQEMQQLKERYRNFDLLIVDDIQFIGKTEKMQEEFFHTFNALYERNKQIVISSDRPPAAIPTLEARLRSRFEGGMMADLGEPDFETRLIILKKKLEEKQVHIDDEVLFLIAQNIKNNIRELEGVLNKIVLMSKMANTPVTVDETKKILNQLIYAPKKFATPKKVIKTISDFYEISEKDLVNSSRKKEMVRPRQITMYVLRDDLKCSFPFIGEKLGKKDHTTAIHAYKKIKNELKVNQDLEEELKLIRERIFTS